MAEVKKRTVVIASVLKTVDDTRAFEKIAVTLEETGEYDVHVIGLATSAINRSNIKWHALKSFRRISLQRLVAPWKIFRIAVSLKPVLFIITTHELLAIALLTKVISGCKVIYDVQENYYRNILYTNAFPKLIRPLVAAYVRLKEKVFSTVIDHFLLAEKGYEREFKFPGSRKTILENKVKRSLLDGVSSTKDAHSITLFFSGTLAETTGVFTAIEIAVGLSRLEKKIRLVIIGFCAHTQTLEKIKTTISPYPFISLIGGDKLVPHEQILRQIKSADFGIISYHVNPSTSNSIPTKLFEYLGAQLPIILTNHKPWVDYCAPYPAAVVFDEQRPDVQAILHGMQQQFYQNSPTDIYWEQEAPRLTEVVKTLTTKV